MVFMVLARIIYGLPFLTYAFLNRDILLGNQEAFFYAGIWGALWLISLILFSLGKFSPWPITHFVFVGETITLTNLCVTTQNQQWLLFILLASFFAIEGLRNDAFHIVLHLCIFTLALILVNRDTGVYLGSYTANTETVMILFSCLLCRAFMSIMESRNVIIQQIVKKIRVYVPEEKSEREEKRKVEKAQEKIEKHKKYIEELQTAIEHERGKNKQLQEIIDSMDMMNNLSTEIANSYFLFSVEPPLQTKMTVDENIDHILRLACHIVGAQYAAFIANEGGEIFLSNSCIQKDHKIDENELVELFNDKIVDSIQNAKATFIDGNIMRRFGIKRLYLFPCSKESKVKGLFLAGFDSDDALTNIHYANLALMVAYRIFGILENQKYMKQEGSGGKS